jgi:hypothetical protein
LVGCVDGHLSVPPPGMTPLDEFTNNNNNNNNNNTETDHYKQFLPSVQAAAQANDGYSQIPKKPSHYVELSTATATTNNNNNNNNNTDEQTSTWVLPISPRTRKLARVRELLLNKIDNIQSQLDGLTALALSVCFVFFLVAI